MTKRELLRRLKSGGIQRKFAAARIARSTELSQLSEDADISLATVERWVEESPRLQGGIWVTGPCEPLSESDVQLISSQLESAKPKGP
jgi:hypothetical protein